MLGNKGVISYFWKYECCYNFLFLNRRLFKYFRKKIISKICISGWESCVCVFSYGV